MHKYSFFLEKDKQEIPSFFGQSYVCQLHFKNSNIPNILEPSLRIKTPGYRKEKTVLQNSI